MGVTAAMIRDGLLHQPDSHVVALGADSWHTWLADPNHNSFRFEGQRGTFGARRERQRNGRYWYAYRRRDGRLRKLYLGRDEDLTLERLESVAAAFSQHGARAQIAAGAMPPFSHLLTTKLHPPPAGPSLVNRPQLLARLAEGLARPLTLVVAPAGFGKTTLLASSLTHIESLPLETRLRGGDSHPTAAIRNFTFAWLSLDASDSDPVRFWSYLIAALDPVCPGLAQAGRALLETPHPSSAALLPLLNALAAADVACVLVLDDYHVIESPVVHDLLGFFVERMPPGLRLVITSRVDPPLPLARLRARGQLTELRAADLRFAAAETASFLALAAGVELTPQDLHTLGERTEGWAAGLQLAALALRERPDPAVFIASFAGSHRAVADYLADEVLRGQPEQVRRFLLLTSVLDRMCAELCDVIIGDSYQPVEGESQLTYRLSSAGSQDMLDHIERANLFLIPLDDERRWYRYHHMFAEMLREQLRRQRPDLFPELHRLAAGWYADHALLREAIAHALASGDLDLAAHLIEREAPSTLWVYNELHTLLVWLGAFPEPMLRARPRLLLARAWALLARVQLSQAANVVHVLESLVDEASPDVLPRALLGELATIRSFILRIEGNLPAALEVARHALGLVPADDLNVRSLLVNNMQHAYMALGDTFGAERALAEVEHSPANAPSFYKLNRVLGNSWLLSARGQLHEAYRFVRQALESVADHAGATHSFAGMIRIAHAELLYEWNDLDGAEREARSAAEDGERWWNNDIRLQVAHLLALLASARGDHQEAAELYRRFDDLSLEYGVGAIAGHVRVGQAYRAIVAGELDVAARWARESGLALADVPSPDMSWEYSVLARLAIAERRADEALPLLAQLQQLAEQGGYVVRVLDLLKLRALALHALGRTEESQATLIQALALAAPGGYIRTFVNEGPTMGELVAECRRALRAAERGQSAAGPRPPGRATTLLRYVERLSVAFGSSQSGETEASSVAEPLTSRELDVLRLLAAGLGNQEIAASLIIAVTTVRSHIKSIYAKLGVHSRIQAVEQARTISLIAR